MVPLSEWHVPNVQAAVLVEMLPVSGVPLGSSVAGVSVLPAELISTKPRLSVKSLASDVKTTKKWNPLFLTPARVASMGNCGFKFFSTCSLLPEHHDPKLGLQGDRVEPSPTSPRSSNQPMDQSGPTLRKRGAAGSLSYWPPETLGSNLHS